MAARLVFLSGSKAGTTIDLADTVVTLGRKPDRTVVYSVDDVLVSTEHASVRLREGRYVLRDDGSRNGTFVNAQQTKERVLEHGDLIQLGPGGPSFRFVQETRSGAIQTVDVAAQVERRAAEVASMADGAAPVLTTRDLVAVTYYRLTKRIRGWVYAVVGLIAVAVAGVLYMQGTERRRVDAMLAAFVEQLPGADVTRDLERVREELVLLRDALASAGRGPARMPGLGTEAVSQIGRGVGLVTVSYGFTLGGGKELLRYELDAQGQVATARGRDGKSHPRVSFSGSGAPVQGTATASGFLVDSTGYIITSRHVTEPWLNDPELQRLRAEGQDLTAQITEAHVYFPPGEQPLPIVVHRRSDAADVAVVRAVGRPGVPFVVLAADTSLVRPGDAVLVLGFPADARGLLARVDTTTANDILRRAAPGAALVAELGNRKLIQPFWSDGNVATTTADGITHNAGATFGGRGGPLVDRRGRVVAVQGVGSGAAQQALRIRYGWDILPAHIQRSQQNAGARR